MISSTNIIINGLVTRVADTDYWNRMGYAPIDTRVFSGKEGKGCYAKHLYALWQVRPMKIKERRQTTHLYPALPLMIINALTVSHYSDVASWYRARLKAYTPPYGMELAVIREVCEVMLADRHITYPCDWALTGLHIPAVIPIPDFSNLDHD